MAASTIRSRVRMAFTRSRTPAQTFSQEEYARQWNSIQINSNNINFMQSGPKTLLVSSNNRLQHQMAAACRIFAYKASKRMYMHRVIRKRARGAPTKTATAGRGAPAAGTATWRRCPLQRTRCRRSRRSTNTSLYRILCLA